MRRRAKGPTQQPRIMIALVQNAGRTRSVRGLRYFFPDLEIFA